MNNKRTYVGKTAAAILLFSLALIGLIMAGSTASIAAPRQTTTPPAQQAPPPPPTAGAHLEITEGSASYRVQEQLAGINFPNEAIGTTPTVSGTLVINPDGSIDSAQSKLTIDLRNLKSDQERRDGYLQNRTLETAKFPVAEFVAKRLQGVPVMIPSVGETGFELTGDLTIHGMTSEVTWRGIATFFRGVVAGRAQTDFTFATFGLTKPALAFLLSVDDKIHLDMVFKFKRT